MSAFADLLAARARQTPHADMLSDGQRCLDAAAVQSHCAAIGMRFQALGPDVRVLSQLDNGIDWVLLDLSLRAAGAVHVPLPPFFNAEQFAHVLRDCTPDWVALPAAHPGPGTGWQALDDAHLPSLRLWQRQAPVLRVGLPEQTACITYTSGTTGRAKGVCLAESALLQVARSLCDAAASLQVERHLCVLPLSTLLENIGGIYAALLSGCEIRLPSLAELGYSGSTGLDPQRLLAAIDRHAPHSVILVPQLLDGLLSMLQRGGALREPLRFVAVGGARVAPRLLQRAATLAVPVFEGYGLSECASVVCLNRPGAQRAGTVGRPLPHAQLRIDEHGEVHVSGAGHLGYLGEPACAVGEVATGDLGRFDADGYLTLYGRRRNVFITAFGRNVSPEWMESELIADPLIAQALVDGEARPWNIAVLVPAHAGVTLAELQRAVATINRRFPDYARVADVVVADAPFSVANGLATANGRPRRDAVLARHAAAIEAAYRQPLPAIPAAIPSDEVAA